MDCFDVQFLSSREGEHPLGQGGSPLGSQNGIVYECREFFVAWHTLAHQFKTAEHCHQQIVEIVGDAAGQVSDGFHFLGLNQRLARFSSFC